MNGRTAIRAALRRDLVLTMGVSAAHALVADMPDLQAISAPGESPQHSLSMAWHWRSERALLIEDVLISR